MAVVNLKLYLTLLVSSVLFFPAANGQHYANPPLVIGPGDRIPEPLVVNRDSLVAFFVNEETDQVKVIFQRIRDIRGLPHRHCPSGQPGH